MYSYSDDYVSVVGHELDDGVRAWALLMHHPSSQHNIVDEAFGKAMINAMEHLEPHVEVGRDFVVVTSSKRQSFLAGADIALEMALTDRTAAATDSARLKEALDRFETLDVPSVALINGVCLGGGLEIALACTYRVALPHATQIGLPEVKLGLLPGGGGCVRLPRLIGLLSALPLLLAGSTFNAEKGQRLGIIDHVPTKSQADAADESTAGWYLPFVEPFWRDPSARHFFFNTANKYPQLLSGKLWLERQAIRLLTQRQLWHTTKGRYPSPYAILDTALAAFAAPDRDAAARIESDAFGDVCVTHECKVFTSLFLKTRELKKQAVTANGIVSEGTVGALECVGVVGAGFMGRGIAQALIHRKTNVVLFDCNAKARENAIGLIRSLFDYLVVKKRSMSSSEADELIRTRLTIAHEWSALEQCSLVIECVTESLSVKQSVVDQLQALPNSSHRVIASNTSSLSIREIASKAKHKDQIVGLHFFNPNRNITPIVEVVNPSKSEGMSERVSESIASAAVIAERIGKTPVLCRDYKGFVVNRIASQWYQKAIELAFGEGLGIVRVDEAMRSVGFGQGPFGILDSIGLVVATDVARNFNPDMVESEMGRALTMLVENGCTGDQSDKGGFYVTDKLKKKSKKKKEENPLLRALVKNGRASRVWTHADVCDALMLAMSVEAVRCLDQGVVDDAASIDALMVMAMGYPPHIGGPLSYLDCYSHSHAIKRLNDLSMAIPDSLLHSTGVFHTERPSVGAPCGARIRCLEPMSFVDFISTFLFLCVLYFTVRFVFLYTV